MNVWHADSPLVREVRNARAEGSSIEQICRIWKLSEDDVRSILRTGFKRSNWGKK